MGKFIKDSLGIHQLCRFLVSNIKVKIFILMYLQVEAHASSCGMPQKTSTSSPFAARRATPPSKFFQTNETKKRSLNTAVQDANPILPNKKVKTEEDSSLMEEVVAKSKEKVGRSGRVPLADTLRPKVILILVTPFFYLSNYIM